MWDDKFHSEKTDRIRIQWASVDVLVNWDSEDNVTLVLFLGYINKRLRKALEDLVLQARDVRDPYTWHRVIINEADEIYNDDVWKIYDSYRDLELVCICSPRSCVKLRDKTFTSMQVQDSRPL